MTLTVLREEQETMLHDDDFFMVDDIDPTDETELRHIVAEVEAFAGNPGKGLRISILNSEQWDQAIKTLIAKSQQRTAALHIHTLRDPRDHSHLFVSPSAVKGVNEGVQVIVQELIYALLRCIGSPLEGPLRRGVDDVVAETSAELVNFTIFTKHYPRESALVRGLIEILRNEHGYEVSNWSMLLRRDPEKFFTIFRKSKFLEFWLSYIEEEADSDSLISALTNPDLSMNSEFVSETERVIIAYLDSDA